MKHVTEPLKVESHNATRLWQLLIRYDQRADPRAVRPEGELQGPAQDLRKGQFSSPGLLRRVSRRPTVGYLVGSPAGLRAAGVVQGTTGNDVDGATLLVSTCSAG